MLINGKEINISPRANLKGANLREADLREADLREADLREADLREADLKEANLGGATLGGANLCGANLWGANLIGANLWGANLRGADLREADLRGADLWDAALRGADLRGADLRGADLREADLRGADLRGAKNISPVVAAQMLITPEGELIGWKKLADDVICKLMIPRDAKRYNATGRKCRAEYAIVLEGEGVSKHDSDFVYAIGATVHPTEPFDDDRWNECAPGIHFFLTREEAEEY